MQFPEEMDIPMPLPVANTESEHYQKGRMDAANGHGFDTSYTQQFDEEDELICDPEGRFDYDAGFRSWFPGEVVIP